MLVAKWDDLGLVMARDARKGLAYNCPGCGADLTLRQGAVVVHHFAHKASEERCGYAAGETLAHMKGKQLLHDAFTRRGLRVEVECRLETPLGERIADVLVHDGKHRIAFEIQHSEISVEDLARRTQAYMSARVRVIWVPLLDPARAEALRRDPAPYKKIADADRWPRWHLWLQSYQRATPYLDVESGDVFAVSLSKPSWPELPIWGQARGPWRLDDMQVCRFWDSGEGFRWHGESMTVTGPAARARLPYPQRASVLK